MSDALKMRILFKAVLVPVNKVHVLEASRLLLV